MTMTGKNTCAPGNDSEAQYKDYRNPEYEVTKTENSYVIKVNLPGTKKEDIVTLLDNESLLIEGKRMNPQLDGWKARHKEIVSANYRLKLDVNIPVIEDKISATYRDGVLVVTLPYREKTKPVDISVN